MAPVRVMHYINQFFAGKGGEGKADTPAGYLEGPAGPGKRLQELLGDSAKIVVTVYCGDNYFNEHQDEVKATIQDIAKKHDLTIVVAGPAFFAGRYGFACIEVCHSLATSLGLSCVTGMHIENPALSGYKQYKDRQVFAFPTSESVGGMEDALSKMARCVSKLASGLAMGPAAEEGYIPRGLRVVAEADKSGADRAFDMLLARLAGRPFVTEVPIEGFEETPIAPPLVDLKNAHILLASTAGVHPVGNPYGFKNMKNNQWRKYPIDKLNSMRDAKWMVIHSGMSAEFMEPNPNYGVPLDVSREMEREGLFARLSPHFYGTTGNGGTIDDMEAIGREMAAAMKAEGVNGVLLVST
ncbi:MAG: glycine/betaine/sarcosine/D-proline family reductase selenoprotein B [Chloroflexi bacterium]|nr:glycine/betaine/sarcosine/D-proline family reductase selenoprotein B [Chloroflexota bacterium]